MSALSSATAAEIAAEISAGSASTSTIDEIVSLLRLVVSSMGDGDAQLRAVAWGKSTTLDCDDAPIVIIKTDNPNGACPDDWGNASCSCLADLKGSTSWTVPVTLLSSNGSTASSGSSSEAPANVTVASITSINRLLIPSELTSLALVGDDASPLNVDVETTGLTSLLQGFVVSLGTSSLTNYEMVNISLASATLDANFVPASVTNMTLRNCALTEISSDVFSSRHDTLQYLDLSVNSLTDLSLGLTDATTSTIQTVNLSYNSLTSIPSELFDLDNLKSLDLRGNEITERTISSSEFAKLEGMTLLKIDAAESSTSCTTGNQTPLNGVTFCVIASASSGSSSSSTSGSGVNGSEGEGSSSSAAIYGGIGGAVGVVIIVIALILWRRARAKKTAELNINRPGGIGKRRMKNGYMHSHDDDDDFDGSTFSSSGPEELLSHPLIVMNRLPLADVDIRESISKGGFGEVFSGYYLGRHVAVKKVHPYYQSDPRRVEMFLREIVLMATLQHPRIVEFIGVGWSALRHLIAVTEFMDQGDLRNVMLHYKRNQPPVKDLDQDRSTRTNSTETSRSRTSVLFSGGRSLHSNSTGSGRGGSNADMIRNGPVEQLTWESHKLKWALQIAEALVYLHSLQPMVIHRDLKSKNVLVDSSMDAKLSDFGISREHSIEETHMTTGVGTSFWIAPEVLLGGHYNEKADVFSFGIVLSELDTEDYPYWNYKQSSHGSGSRSGSKGENSGSDRPRGMHQHAILGMVAAGELRPTFSTECPLGVLQVAEQCLQSDPDTRPTSAMVFHMLQQVMNEPKPFARITSATMSPTASTTQSAGDSFYKPI